MIKHINHGGPYRAWATFCSRDGGKPYKQSASNQEHVEPISMSVWHPINPSISPAHVRTWAQKWIRSKSQLGHITRNNGDGNDYHSNLPEAHLDVYNESKPFTRCFPPRWREITNIIHNLIFRGPQVFSMVVIQSSQFLGVGPYWVLDP